MNASTQQLFVYGSLRSGFRSSAYDYLTKYFTLAGEAMVKGRLLDNGRYPVAVPTTEEYYIKGELYTINNKNEFSWAIDQLDDYEGLNVMDGEKPLYRRDIAIVHSPDNITGEAWIYWYGGSIENMRQIETGDMLEYLQHKKTL